MSIQGTGLLMTSLGLPRSAEHGPACTRKKVDYSVFTLSPEPVTAMLATALLLTLALSAAASAQNFSVIFSSVPFNLRFVTAGTSRVLHDRSDAPPQLTGRNYEVADLLGDLQFGILLCDCGNV
ncbi:hypothetical protein J6590_061975 [Homalodisca vitripennis]|nr:hypothetical protein J6590_061975 [Homalodisca vitripennis]